MPEHQTSRHQTLQHLQHQTLSARGVSFAYKNGPMILRKASLSVERGEVVGLMGPSGRGKTTLGRLMAGMIEPTHGSIEIDSEPLPRSGVAPVQMILQHPELAVDPRWTLRQILCEASAPDPGLLEELSISDSWLDRYPNELSGGELQRIAVARALLTGAPFLIADEISAMLDPITQAQLWQALLARVGDGRTGILAISHDSNLLKEVAHRVVDTEEVLHPSKS